MSARPKRVGEVLLRDGAVSEEALTRALADQRLTGKRIGELLVEQGHISPTVLVNALAECHGVRGCRLRHGLIDPELLSLIGDEEADRMRCIPMFRLRDTLTVAMTDPQSLPTIDRLRELTGLKIRPVLALDADITEYLRKYAGGNIDVDEFLTSLSESDVEVIERERVDEAGSTTDLDRMVEGSPIVNLVNIALLTAVRDKASDIHIEPNKQGTLIRYRVDGMLRDLMRPPAGMHSAIVSRVKVIGKMDIAEKRLPQEGRVRIVAENREIDLRVSSMPTLLGEKLVIRVLDKENLHVRLEDLGFRIDALTTFKRVLRQPHGLVLVTGPTGSGKTTTLYSALDLLRSPERNIVTVEDPVEYQLDLVNQIQVQENIGMTFARALRSILRQDPDVIMVGEIRDEETARVGVQAALTGHLVLATLHTNDAPGAVARLVDMNVESYLLSAAINGVVAQPPGSDDLLGVRHQVLPIARALIEDLGRPELAGRSFRKGDGCMQCHDTGFRGRVGIYEVMEVTPTIRRMVYHERSTHEIREKLREHGALSLRDEGIAIALEGRTSLEEVVRVTHSDEDEASEPATLRRVA